MRTWLEQWRYRRLIRRIATWGLLILQMVFSVAVALYPRFLGTGMALKSGAPTPKALWLFSGLVILSAIVQGLDKKWVESWSKRRIQDITFFESYNQVLSGAVQILGELRSVDEVKLRKAQQDMLIAISSMVYSFYKKDDNIRINATLMRPHTVQEYADGNKFKSNVMFVDSSTKLESYSNVLRLTIWATPEEPEELVLPVITDPHRILFGAPKAFKTRTTQVINDLADEATVTKLIDNQHPDVRLAIKTYLSGKTEELRSFASIPLICGTTVVGVLNIHSNKPSILGVEKEHRKDLECCLQPFVTLITTVVAHELIKHEPEGS